MKEPARRKPRSFSVPEKRLGEQLAFLAALSIAVVGVYAQVYSYGFIEYDDPGYVRDNLNVRLGLTWAGVRWAFTTNWLGHWHPLTWLSYLVEVQLFGVNPAVHHLVNVALHLANTLLLFGVLARMTGDLWPSFIAAALFGVHPLHVESVAWISERKDVLSTLFWMLTTWAYLRYVGTGSRVWYAAVLTFFALGLSAKPMLVTLPFVFLLMDWWPLGRLRRGSGHARDRGPAPIDARALLVEKIPQFGLTVLFSIVAYATQEREGAMLQAGLLPLGLRLNNAMVAYVIYLLKTVWPTDLAVLYPYELSLPAWQGVLAASGLIVVCLIAWRSAARHPYLLVGWLWYLGTLVPVIGLVQIGSQAYADRYTYVPLIGIFIIVGWGGRSLITRFKIPAPIAAAATLIVISAYAVAAWSQVRLWQSNEGLLRHTIDVTRDNCIAMNNLGVALANEHRLDEALPLFREALRIKPDYADPHSNLGLYLWRNGQPDEALEHYRTAVRVAPHIAENYSSMGMLLVELGHYDEGMAKIREALRLKPDLAAAWVHLGAALNQAGHVDQANDALLRALEIDPENSAGHTNLGIVRVAQGRLAEGEEEFRAALRFDSRSVNAWSNLGLVLAQQGKTAEAIDAFAEAVRVGPDQSDVRLNFGNALYHAGRLPEAVGQYEHALDLDPDMVAAHYHLGVALTEAGRNDDAILEYEQVLRLDPNHARAHNDLGVTLVALNRLGEAIEHFEKALALDPTLADAQVNIGIARARAQHAE